MKYRTVFIVIFLVLYGSIVLTKPLDINSHLFNTSNGENSNSSAPKWVTTVDGKSFYYDNTGRNWTLAGEYCAIYGLQLASITSKAQADALQRAYRLLFFEGGYWTSGRDAQEPRQFSWNATGEPISSDYPPFGNRTVEYQTCLFYYSAFNASKLDYFYCDYDSMRTLCNT